ncbi:hypothetical protein AVEN_62419-1, partial [Araneus ventricosus]
MRPRNVKFGRWLLFE